MTHVKNPCQKFTLETDSYKILASIAAATMTQLAAHPQSKILRLQLRQNLVLQHLSAAQWLEFESLLEISDYAKGETLEHQGTHSMEQYFVIDGVLKRVVSNAQGKEMILRFAPETDIDTSYAAWRLKTPMPVLDTRRYEGARGKTFHAAMGCLSRAARQNQKRI